MGLRMIPAKLDAIARGDLSGLIVHPIFIHIAHLVGCLFHNHDSPQVGTSLETAYFQLAISALSSHNLSPLDKLQAYTLLGTYLYLKHQFNDGWEMCRKANEVIVQYGMHITIPSAEAVASLRARGSEYQYGAYGHLKAMDEEDERRSCLCHLLFMEMSSEIMIEMPVRIVPWLGDELRALTVSLLSVVSCAIRMGWALNASFSYLTRL